MANDSLSPFYKSIRPTNKRRLWSVLKWLLTRKHPDWPSIKVQPQKVLNQRGEKKELWVTFINHSTFLIQLDGKNILTDPIWSERCSPFSWLGPKRAVNPGVNFEDLPPIDIVLVSHNHYDHMDLPTLRLLQKIHKPNFYVSKGNKAYLHKKGILNVEELDWWQSLPIDSTMQLTYVPGLHFSARGLFDHNKTLWGGFFIKGLEHSVYFAADTGYGGFFKEIKQRLGEPSLSLLPIGAYKPRWFMSPVHMSPEDAVKAHVDLKSRQSIGIHFGTFPLADEAFLDPIIELEQALKLHRLSPADFIVLQQGEGKKIESNF